MPARVGPATISFQVETIPVGPVGLGTANGVWSGSEFLIFGGAEPEVPQPEGARSGSDYGRWRASPGGTPWSGVAGYAYDPRSRSWRGLPGAPPSDSSARDSVAWHCGAAFLMTQEGTGYRYDPTTGETVAIATEGAPNGCSGQRIATQGSLALVFGCRGCAGHVYDAATDSWSEMGTLGEPIDWGRAGCGPLPSGISGDHFVVLRRDRGIPGAAWNIRTREWHRIPEQGSPTHVWAGPVGDGRAVYVVGQQGPRLALFRYELESRTWSDMPLSSACQGHEVALREGVLVQAGGSREERGAICGYDLVHGMTLDPVSPFHDGRATVSIFGDGQILMWAQRLGTGHGHGEMPRVPTHWIENEGRLVSFEIRR